tara:strand:- start:45 stop:536 length:492 start_codon:yes stop_codon:yes gene_type:complete
MYKLEIQPKNNNANGHYFNKWLNENSNHTSSIYNDFGIDVYFSSEPSQLVKDEIVNKYISLTVADLLYGDIIKGSYETFRKDGESYFDDIRVGLVLKYKAQELNADDIYEIESGLDSVITKILRGDWMSASFEMGHVSVGGALTQEFYDELLNYINNYVAENY